MELLPSSFPLLLLGGRGRSLQGQGTGLALLLEGIDRGSKNFPVPADVSWKWVLVCSD